MQISTLTQQESTPQSYTKLNPHVIKSREEAIKLSHELHFIKNAGVDGFIYFVFKYCRTLDLDNFAYVQGRQKQSPQFNLLPKKAYIRDLCKLLYYAPNYGPALIIGKSRQVTVSWVIQCYVVYLLLFKQNQRIAWTNLKLEQSQAALKRIIKIFQYLTIPYPKIEYNKSEILVTHPDPALDLNNYLKAFPRSETGLTSESWTAWIPDEFSKLSPAKLQDEVWREATVCVHGQIIIPSTAAPNTLFQAFYQEAS